MSKFEVAGRLFKTQVALKDTIRSIRDAYPVGSDLGPDDTHFMSSLIENYHPEAQAKIGVGVKRMWTVRALYGTVGFCLERLDGTTTDFSFMKCLRPPTPWQEFQQAARTAVTLDINEFRKVVFADGPLTCPYTSQVITAATSHIDHEPPLTFDRLLRKYIEQTGVAWEAIKIKPTQDNNMVTEFDDPEYEAGWRTWHKVNCRLRAVSRLGNLSHVRKEDNLVSQL